MLIRINAFDTLFFRDGRPFSRGDDSWANGVFPPAPSVLYGVLRSAYLSQQGFSDANIGASANLRIKQVFLAYSAFPHQEADLTYLFPVASDLMCVEDGDECSYSVQQARVTESVGSYPSALSHQLFPTAIDKEQPKAVSEDQCFLTLDGLTEYCQQNTLSESNTIARAELISLEPKVGIGRENFTRSSAEGQLYRVGLNRMASKDYKLSILIDFEGIELTDSGLLKIGGEGKTAAYQRIAAAPSLPQPTLDSDCFKLYLLTPAIFEQGWLPKWIDATNLRGHYQGMELQLLCANLRKPENIGGFDIAAGKPKPMYQAVPAGSVYYFRIISGDQQQAQTAFHGASISDLLGTEGFGLGLVAKPNLPL